MGLRKSTHACERVHHCLPVGGLFEWRLNDLKKFSRESLLRNLYSQALSDVQASETLGCDDGFSGTRFGQPFRVFSRPKYGNLYPRIEWPDEVVHVAQDHHIIWQAEA